MEGKGMHYFTSYNRQHKAGFNDTLHTHPYECDKEHYLYISHSSPHFFYFQRSWKDKECITSKHTIYNTNQDSNDILYTTLAVTNNTTYISPIPLPFQRLKGYGMREKALPRSVQQTT